MPDKNQLNLIISTNLGAIMQRNLNTVVAGHLCLDIIPDLSALPPGEFLNLFQPGRLIDVGAPLFSTGGPVSNTGLALHILGIPTRLMGKVGDDLFGQAVLSLIRRWGNELILGMIVDSETSTSYTVIINPPGVDRIFLHDPGANHTFCPDDIDYYDLELAALFHFGYPPLMRRMYERNGVDLAEILSRARATGVTISLDMSFPDPASPSGKVDWRSILLNALPYVDIFTPSIEELLFTLHPKTYQQLCEQAGSIQILPLVTPELLSDLSQELIEMGVKIVLIKTGERGAYLRTASLGSLLKMGRAQPADPIAWAELELWAPCFQVEVVGTTGSGDSTIAGFLSGFLRGLSPQAALTAAVGVGACNVEAADALGGLCSWETILHRISSGWDRLPLQLNSPGWKWDNNHALWYKD